MYIIPLIFVVLTVSQTQPVPYLTFHGFNLSNHSYIPFGSDSFDPDGVGYDGTGRGVECHTDLTTCCSSSDGSAAGAWYFPNGNRLSFDQYYLSSIYMRRESQKVVLYQRPVGYAKISGIYQCKIPITLEGDLKVIFAGIYRSHLG